MKVLQSLTLLARLDVGSPKMREALDADGYTWLRAVFDHAAIMQAHSACGDALGSPEAASSLIGTDGERPHGARNLLRLWPEVIALARHPRLAEMLHEVVGPEVGLVRGLYFDKTPGDGWALPWHRDTAIAVRTHGQPGRFGKQTIKAGVPHVEAPRELLESMLTARVHLDAMTDSNGPLRVTPGSHRGNSNREPVTLQCHAGDVLLMRPLLLHASAGCVPGHTGHRRVVHLEFAPSPRLPDGYEWDRFISIGGG